MMPHEDFGVTEFQLSKMLNHDSSIVVYDLRKKEDFAKGHIKKSTLVKFDPQKLLDVPQNSKVILVSYDDEQSKKMVPILRSNRIDAYYLIGGISGYTRGLYCTNIFYVGTGYP